MILILTALALILWAGAAYAGDGGGGSSTYPALAPKSEELQSLEKPFYDIANNFLGAYTQPLDQYGKIARPAAQAAPQAASPDMFQQATMYASQRGGSVSQVPGGGYMVRVSTPSSGGGGLLGSLLRGAGMASIFVPGMQPFAPYIMGANAIAQGDVGGAVGSVALPYVIEQITAAPKTPEAPTPLQNAGMQAHRQNFQIPDRMEAIQAAPTPAPTPAPAQAPAEERLCVFASAR